MKKENTKLIEKFLKETNQIKFDNVKKFFSNSIEKNEKSTLIKIENLEKNFYNRNKEKKVLKNISFEIRENENVAILGGNGAGKTTLVEIMVGLNKPTSGKIVNSFETNQSYLQNIGIQFQESSYPIGITTKEIINFALRVYEVKISKEELEGMIKIFGIDEYIKKQAHSLSGGQQQRLNALLAILHKPKIVFLDELSTGLDITIRTRIKKFLREFTKLNNMTICLVSHDMEEVEYLTDRIIVILEGKIVVDAYKEDIIKEFKTFEKFIENYI